MRIILLHRIIKPGLRNFLYFTGYSIVAEFCNIDYTNSRNGVFDYEGKNMTYYPEVPTIFAKLHTKGIKIAVGTIGLDARNSQRLLELFELDQYISYRHLYLVNYEVMFER